MKKMLSQKELVDVIEYSDPNSDVMEIVRYGYFSALYSVKNKIAEELQEDVKEYEKLNSSKFKNAFKTLKKKEEVEFKENFLKKFDIEWNLDKNIELKYNIYS